MIKPVGGMLWQWDTGRQVEIDLPAGCTINQVHFANSKSTAALAVAVTEADGALVAEIPNILLQQSLSISAYGYYADENGGVTKISTVLFVAARPKPEDYVYTETEVKTWELLDQRLTELEKGGLSGILPAGGTKGQVLSKKSDADGDVEWTDKISYSEVSNNSGGITVTIGGI